MLLVRRARWQDQPLDRRPHANNGLGIPQQQSFWQPAARGKLGAWHAKAGRGDAPPIVNNSRPGELVYDPFLGSGTSLIAAEMTGRLCYGLELCPAYVDVIVQRWQA